MPVPEAEAHLESFLAKYEPQVAEGPRGASGAETAVPRRMRADLRQRQRPRDRIRAD